jgi:hypothetical protein
MSLDILEMIYSTTHHIIQSGMSFKEGLSYLIEIANSHSDRFETLYWQQVKQAEFPFDLLQSWAKEGYENLEALETWSVIVLDCGDCPETFFMRDVKAAMTFSYSDLTAILMERPIIALARFSPNYPFDTNIAIEHDLVMHHISELNHPILSWYEYPFIPPGFDLENDSPGCGDDESFLWLAVCSMALCEPLKNPSACQSILKNRSKAILLSGFEEDFVYLGTITPQGLSFADPRLI